MLNYGLYIGTETEPGIHWSCPFGRDVIKINKARITHDLKEVKVIDYNGNPLIVSGVVTYCFLDARKAALDIHLPENFIHMQAMVAMKHVVSQYPYEHFNLETDVKEGDYDTSEEDDKNPCLKSDPEVVSKALIKELQEIVRIAGAKVLDFRFNEISYSPEIAAGMLKKQQAKAVIAARSTLVDGAVTIAATAATRLDKRGVKMTHHERGTLVSNLLTVVTADEAIHPMIQLGSK